MIVDKLCTTAQVPEMADTFPFTYNYNVSIDRWYVLHQSLVQVYCIKVKVHVIGTVNLLEMCSLHDLYIS